MVLMTEQVVGQGMVTGIADQENVVSAHRPLDQTLGVTVLETGAVTLAR